MTELRRGNENFWDVVSAAQRVALLDLDARLADLVPADAQALARRALTAPTVSLKRGRVARLPQAPDDCLGLLLVEGVMLRSIEADSGRFDEIVGTGDVTFVQRAAHWPEVLALLYGRAVDRSRRLAALAALARIRRLDVRLLRLFWRLADRWGRVTPDGLVVPLPLTHATLASLVGATRPSVSTALMRLVREGRLSRRDDGTWLVHALPPEGEAQAG